MNYHTFLADLAAVIVIINTIRPYLSKIYTQFRRWGIRRTANLVSGLSLIATGLSMVILSVIAQDQMFSATGFILPLATPSIHDLSSEQASIFGNFSNFFYSTLGIGIIGITIGIFRINKFFTLGNDESIRIYQ
jgi:hypothetical protein